MTARFVVKQETEPTTALAGRLDGAGPERDARRAERLLVWRSRCRRY